MAGAAAWLGGRSGSSGSSSSSGSRREKRDERTRFPERPPWGPNEREREGERERWRERERGGEREREREKRGGDWMPWTECLANARPPAAIGKDFYLDGSSHRPRNVKRVNILEKLSSHHSPLKNLFLHTKLS